MLPWHLKGSRFRGRSSELEAKDRALLAVLPWVSHLTSLSLCLLVCKIGACLPHTKTRLSELCAFWAQESASNLQMHSALYPKVLAEACSLPSPDLLTRSRSRWYLLDELLLVQQMQPWDVVLLLQGQRKVLHTSDRQLLLHREDDVLQAQRHKGHRGTGQPSRSGTEQGGLPSLSLCSSVQLGRERPTLTGSTANAGSQILTGHMWDFSLPLKVLHSPLPFPQGSSTTHTATLSCFTRKAEAVLWGLMPLFKVSRFILSLESASSTAYQTESHHLLSM